MVIRPERIQQLLQNVAKKSENPWQLYAGLDQASAVQILNKDGNNPYICQTGVPSEVLATDVNFNIRKEFYEVTLVTDTEPDMNLAYFLSHDNGTTLDRVNYLFHRSQVKQTYYKIFLQNN